MSYDVNQYYGLGLKVHDIEQFMPDKTRSTVFYPFEVRNLPTVSKALLVKYGFFDQFAKIEKNCPSGRINGERSEETLKFELIEKTEAEDGIQYELKKMLGHLVNVFKQNIEEHLIREEVEALLYCCLACYLGYIADPIPDIDLGAVSFIISSTQWGNVHNLGGMVPDEPYFILNDWFDAKQGSWPDPRQNPIEQKILKAVEKNLVGEKHPGFNLLTPVFGG